MLAVAWPFGCPARFADSGGAQTRFAQTVRAFSPPSAALLDQATGQNVWIFAQVGRGWGEGGDAK